MLAKRLMNSPFMGWPNHFSEMDRLARQMNALSSAMRGKPGMQMFPSNVFPAINLTENKDKYFVRAELPGIKSEEIELQVNGRNLTISGERKIQSEGTNVKYHRREREDGKFSRVIEMPGEIDGDGVDAKIINGLLMVEIPKAEVAQPKQITVH